MYIYIYIANYIYIYKCVRMRACVARVFPVWVPTEIMQACIDIPTHIAVQL